MRIHFAENIRGRTASLSPTRTSARRDETNRVGLRAAAESRRLNQHRSPPQRRPQLAKGSLAWLRCSCNRVGTILMTSTAPPIVRRRFSFSMVDRRISASSTTISDQRGPGSPYIRVARARCRHKCRLTPACFPGVRPQQSRGVLIQINDCVFMRP